MGEKELFNFGDKELNLNSLLNNITSNQQSYLDYYSTSISDSNAFIEKVNYLKEGIKNGTITTDGTGIYYDKLGNLSKEDKLMNNALHYIDTIAREQSKQTRSLTRSEIEEKQRQKQEQIREKQQIADAQRSQKLNFDSEHPFNFEYAFKSQFGPTLEIPYNSLKKAIVKKEDGSEDYSTVNSHFKKAFDSMRNALNKYNDSEEYISQVNDLETALLDGVWDHNDELAIHKAGLTRDLDNLKDLFTYKFQAYNPKQNYKQKIDQVVNPGDFTVIDGEHKAILYLDENGKQVKENITDEEYYKLSGTTPVNKNTNDDLNLDELGKDLEEDHLGWEVIGPIVADIYSIASPEPISATIAGLASDITGIVQDVQNGGDFHWGQHGFNIGATALGAIPYIGDAGNVTKVGSKIVKASQNINKIIGSAIDFLNKIPKAATKTAKYGTVGAGLTWAYLDLTDEDSVLLEQGKKALADVENGEITAENIIAVGNALAVALQVRKGWKKFRSLDPNMPKPTKSGKTAKPKQSAPVYRDELIKRIKTNNESISQEDLNAINLALDKLTNKGAMTRARQALGGTNEELTVAKQVLREKGKFSEEEIADIIKQVLKHAKGGVIKASGGAEIPWRLNFNGTSHQMDDIYRLFVQNASSYDAKQMAESFNKLNSDEFKSLNFENRDNTLGFNGWNTTFNQSGLNNLFGYNEDRSDYLGVTTKSRNYFVNYLKDQGGIKTGNGTLAWDPNSNQWEYSDWVDPNPSTNGQTPETNTTENAEGTQSEVEIPEVTDLTLKEFNLRKAPNLNPNGMLNSIVGYVANEAANAKKREIQKQIPIYQEVMSPEKAFKTAYTYDLEKSKNELEAEAHNIQPVTSDVNAFYSARNEAIKNARAYTTKIDTEINNRIHEVNDANADIAYENAVNRTETVNSNAKNRHDWVVEQLQGQSDFIDAANASFQNLNKKIEHTLVTAAREKQAKRDSYVNTHILAGLKINPSNYINGWTRHHDLIWYKGQNGQLETDAERAEYQQLLAVVNQASGSLFSQYENIHYPGMDVLHVSKFFKQDYDPSKHGNAALRVKHGAKIDKQKIGNFINKLK